MTTTDAPTLKSGSERVTTAGGDGGNTEYAGRHRSFPIASPADVKKAARAIGRAGDDNYSPDELKKRITAIAKRRGDDYVAELPDAWKADAWKADAKEAAAIEVVDDEPIEDDDSLEARIQVVRQALNARCCPALMVSGVQIDPDTVPYVLRTWDDRVAYMLGDTLYLLDYTMDGDACVLGDEPVEADVLYAPEQPGEVEEVKQPAQATTRRTLALTESVLVEAADKPSGTLQVTLLKAGWSLNGRYYSPDVVKESAPLFEGVRAFGDHPAKGERPERSIWDQIGFYRGVRYDATTESLTGTLKLVGGEDRKAHILDWAAESIGAGQPLMGLSINAVGETHEGESDGREGVLVDRLIAADSVDVVTRPAAGGAFERLAATEGDSLTRSLLAALSYDEWREARPEFVRQLLEAQAAVQETAALAEARQQLTATAAQTAAAGRVQALEAELTTAQTTLAEQAVRLAVVDRAARLAALLEQVHIPFAYRGRVTKKLELVPEAQWPAFLEAEMEDLTALVRQARPAGQQPVGPLVETTRPAGADYALPIAEDGLNYRQWEAAKAARQRSN